MPSGQERDREDFDGRRRRRPGLLQGRIPCGHHGGQAGPLGLGGLEEGQAD